MQLNWLYFCGICLLIPLKLWPNTVHQSTCMPQPSCLLLWYPVFYPVETKAQVGPVQWSKPYSILAPPKIRTQATRFKFQNHKRWPLHYHCPQLLRSNYFSGSLHLLAIVSRKFKFLNIKLVILFNHLFTTHGNALLSRKAELTWTFSFPWYFFWLYWFFCQNTEQQPMKHTSTLYLSSSLLLSLSLSLSLSLCLSFCLCLSLCLCLSQSLSASLSLSQSFSLILLVGPVLLDARY